MSPVALRAAALALALSACASAPPASSPLPATIGAAVRSVDGRVQIGAVSASAHRAGLREGDVVLAYNGTSVSDVRQLERLVLDSRPGSVATLEVRRGARLLVIEVPVREMDLTPAA